MRDISLIWSYGIQEEEAIVFVESVYEALQSGWGQIPQSGVAVSFPEIRPFGNWILSDTNPNGEYASLQWYLDTAQDPKTMILHADRFLDLVLHEPWQRSNPHYDLALVHLPLTDRSARPLPGKAIRGQAAVISLHDIQTIQNDWTRLALVRRLTLHFVGQVLAVPIIEPHGAAACVMRPAHTLPALLALAQQELDADVSFCESCRQEIAQRIAGGYWGNN